MKIKLEPSPSITKFAKYSEKKMVALLSSLPFVFSLSGKYAHRPRYATVYYSGNKISHIAINCWCGNSLFIGKKKHGTFSGDSNSRPICATCEGRAIGAGLVDSQKINGKPVIFSPHRQNV